MGLRCREFASSRALVSMESKDASESKRLGVSTSSGKPKCMSMLGRCACACPPRRDRQASGLERPPRGEFACRSHCWARTSPATHSRFGSQVAEGATSKRRNCAQFALLRSIQRWLWSRKQVAKQSDSFHAPQWHVWRSPETAQLQISRHPPGVHRVSSI